MSAGAWNEAGLVRLDDVMRGHVEGGVPGVVWVVARRGEGRSGAVGVMEPGGAEPVRRDTIFRVSSMTKAVTAVATLILVEECRLRLDEPVDRWLPELADRRVLVDPGGPFDDTVPARRPITVRDLLTFRMGVGGDFSATGPQAVMEAMGALDLGAGPPMPAVPPAPDEWIRRLGTLPLERQPGERWLYNTGSDVLGVLIGRVAGQPFDRFLAERVFEPLGMVDTGFAVPPAARDRFGPCFWGGTAPGEPSVYDPADGQWSTPPAFPAGSAGLVSTVDDWAALAQLLLAGGTYRGQRLLSRTTVETMTTNHLTDEQVATAGPDPWGAVGWGFGVGVQLRRTGPARSIGSYGWDGGLGTTWANDPTEDLYGILLTNQTWTSPTPPPVAQDFWTCTYTALAD